ncbi:unnamed protein product [Calypogeia fissa]
MVAETARERTSRALEGEWLGSISSGQRQRSASCTVATYGIASYVDDVRASRGEPSRPDGLDHWTAGGAARILLQALDTTLTGSSQNGRDEWKSRKSFKAEKKGEDKEETGRVERFGRNQFGRA